MVSDALKHLTAAWVDRYEIQEEIGAGGMATVYLAEDLKHHRKVAVKVLRPELAAVLGAERFVQELLGYGFRMPRASAGGRGIPYRRSTVPVSPLAAASAASMRRTNGWVGSSAFCNTSKTC